MKKYNYILGINVPLLIYAHYYMRNSYCYGNKGTIVLFEKDKYLKNLVNYIKFSFCLNLPVLLILLNKSKDHDIHFPLMRNIIKVNKNLWKIYFHKRDNVSCV